MSKLLKVCLTVSCVCLMVFALSFGCFADTFVTYTGNSGDFVFAPNSNENPADLFENFKDVMPGDVLTQNIVIKNDADKKVDVELFLKSFGADADSKALLEKMNLSVKVVGGDELANNDASVGGKLSEFVSLGKFASGSTATLQVTLNVPKELTNDYADKLGQIKWQFKVQEKPVEVPVKTSDNSHLIVFSAVFIACLGLGILLIALKRKNRA